MFYRFLLTFEPDDFTLQMTFVQRLMDAHKRNQALSILDQILFQLQKENDVDVDKITEVYLRLAVNYFAKQDTVSALSNVTKGLNARADSRKLNQTTELLSDEEEIDFLAENKQIARKIATKVFESNSKNTSEVTSLLGKNANKLFQGARVRSAMKFENIRACIELYRAMLSLQPSDKDAQFRLASCYAKLGKCVVSVALLNRLLNTPSSPLQVLALRASCYREMGNKVNQFAYGRRQG